MRTPIAHALAYPKRMMTPSGAPRSREARAAHLRSARSRALSGAAHRPPRLAKRGGRTYYSQLRPMRSAWRPFLAGAHRLFSISSASSKETLDILAPQRLDSLEGRVRARRDGTPYRCRHSRRLERGPIPSPPVPHEARPSFPSQPAGSRIWHSSTAITGYFIPFVIILTLLVFVHEMGHFLIARRNGVKVETFSIGFGPELFGWTSKSGTRWKISALPLGGYVKMFGDTDAASNRHRRQPVDDAGGGRRSPSITKPRRPNRAANRRRRAPSPTSCSPSCCCPSST